MINENTQIVLNKKIEVADLAGEKVMVDFDTGKYYLLKGPANEIWALIQQPTTVTQVVDSLLDVYEIDRPTCLQNTADFLQQLAENNFISLV